MIEFLSQLLNGLVIGSVYALIAIGFSLIFGIANLINFAQGSLLMLGAFFAYSGAMWGLPLPVAIVLSVALTTVLGMAIERVALRPLQSAPWIAPFLSTLAITFIVDQAAEILWTPEAHRFPSPLADYAWVVGAAFITGVDVTILAVSLLTMLALWLFLTRSWTGRALRAMSQDLDAARQMGVRVDWLRQLAFGLGAALAAIAGVMIAMYYQSIFPQMGIPFGLKGFVAALLGGLASIPGAVVGGVMLGLLEALAVGYVGESFRDMVAYSALLLILLARPQGLLGHRRFDALGGLSGASGTMPSTSIIMGQGGGVPLAGFRLDIPYPYTALALGLLALLPLIGVGDYVLQSLILAFIFAVLAIGLNLLSGAAGVMFIGFAGFFGAGAYIAAIVAKSAVLPVELILLAAMCGAAVLAVAVGFACVSLTGHVVALATLAIGMLLWLVFLNWLPVTGGPNGIFSIPRPKSLLLGNLTLTSLRAQYWQALIVLMMLVLIIGRFLASPLGRSWRAIREDRPAAHAAGLPVRRYLLTAFAMAGACAGAAGALYALLHRYISPDSFQLDTSFLLVAIVILGGMGNMAGAIIAAAGLALLPELLRDFADFRMIVFGAILFLTLRLRPQGLAGVH